MRRNNLPEQFEQLFQEFDSLFEGDGPLGRMNMRIATGTQMKVDVYEEDGGFVIAADVPGFEPEDINVQLDETGRVLTISAQRVTEDSEEETEYLWEERRSESMERRIPLPVVVDGDSVTAEYKNGVLTVEIPVEEEEDHTVTIDIEEDSE